MDRVLAPRLLCLIALLLATQAFTETAGPEFPNPPMLTCPAKTSAPWA